MTGPWDVATDSGAESRKDSEVELALDAPLEEMENSTGHPNSFVPTVGRS